MLTEFPQMPATVIAERIGWEHSITILKDRVRVLRPEYAGIDPADRTVYDPGAATQCDLWFPETRIPVGHRRCDAAGAGDDADLSRFISAVMLPAGRPGTCCRGCGS